MCVLARWRILHSSNLIYNYNKGDGRTGSLQIEKGYVGEYPVYRPAIRAVITSTCSAAKRRKGATRPTITSTIIWDRR